MTTQAFGRACRSIFFSSTLLGMLAACGGDGATKSPDLPPDSVSAITIDCGNPNPVQLSVGSSGACTAICDVENVDKNGNRTTVQQACTTSQSLNWRTDCEGLEISNASGTKGIMTGVSPDMCNVTAKVEKVTSNAERVDVVAVTADCSIVYPKGTPAGDAAPDATCSNVNQFQNDITVPLGVTVPYRAAVRLSDGTLCYAPDAPQGNTACPAGLITFASGTPTVAAFTDNPPVNGVAKTLSTGNSVISATNSISTNTAVLTVVNPTLEAICVEVGNPQLGCSAFAGNAVNCVTTAPNDIPVNGKKQFNAKIYFDVADNDPNTGFVCDVTADANTTWSINDVGDGAGAAPTVAPGGLVDGGPAATQDASVQATYDQDGDPATVNNNFTDDHPFNVVDNLVLGTNSLMVSSTTFDPADPQPTRAACIGSYNLVSGILSPSNPDLSAEKGLFAVTQKCLTTQLSGGACGSFAANTLDDVTDADFVFPAVVPAVHNGHSSEPDGVIEWNVEPGYWSGPGGGCQLVADPASQGDALVATLLGDNSAGVRYTPGAAIDPPAADSREFDLAGNQDNGQIEGAGSASMQTNCVTATYTATNANGTVTTATDGMTIIVLPITNDSLLTDPDASGAVELCNTLVPLFSLGASDGGTDGAIVQVLSGIAALLNPVTTGAGDGGADDGIAQFLDALDGAVEGANDSGLSALTGPLTDAVEAANAGGFNPLNCAIGTALGAVATQDPSTLPEIEDCQP